MLLQLVALGCVDPELQSHQWPATTMIIHTQLQDIIYLQHVDNHRPVACIATPCICSGNLQLLIVVLV